MSISLSRRLLDIAERLPEQRALIGFDAGSAEQVVTWSELAESTTGLAGDLAANHPASGAGVVVLDAANTIGAVRRILALLCAGIPFLPLNPTARQQERERLFAFLERERGPVFLLDDTGIRPWRAAAERPDTARIAYLLPTGGSSGRPKLSVQAGPLRYDPARVPSALRRHAGWKAGQRVLILGPLHHAAPFTTLLDAVLDHNTVVLPRLFAPARAVELVRRYAVEWIALTPAHMRSIVLLADPAPEDFASVRTVLHTAAPCDALTKRRWIDLVGGQALYEMYSATEGIGATLVRGDEWLAHPNTVGRGFFTRIRILDEQGNRMETGSVGRVFMRAPRRAGGDTYLGDQVLDTTPDGFATVGDYGWLDEDGYLYLVPRRHDLINIGGEKVSPAEVESVLLEHPGVLDVVAAPVVDDTLGASVGVSVVRRPDTAVTAAELVAHCRQRLTSFKVPTRVEFVAQVPRSAAGKMERWRVGE